MRPIASFNVITRLLCAVFLLALVVLATLRQNGLDFETYLAEFQDPVNNLTSYEIGYTTLIETIGGFAGFWLVLLIANIVFLVTHRPLIVRTRTWVQAAALIAYLTYVGLFLVYGSPRRLIAYSIVAYIIQQITYDLRDVKRRPGFYFLLIAGAASFHLSSLVFAPVLAAYAFGRRMFDSATKLFAIVAAVVAVLALLYAIGTLDYIQLKILYYVYDAAREQQYLEDVPSVTSGLAKRLLSLALVWFGTRSSPSLRRPILHLCMLEAALYGALGSLSPVLAVVASYFSLCYLLPVLTIRRRQETLSRRSIAFMLAAALYYVPTSIGLIRIFGDKYAL